MPIFKFSNAVTETQTGQFFSNDDLDYLLSNSDNSEWVSAKVALRNSDLFAVINQLSSDLATVKLTADRKRTQGILNNPSAVASRHSFYQSMFAQMLLCGESFAYRHRNANGIDVSWEYIRPSQVNYNPIDHADGLYYDITFDDPRIRPKLHVPQLDVIHFRLLSVDGGLSSVSPLLALSREMDIQKASNKLTMNALTNSLNMNGILKIKNGGLLDFKTKQARSRQAQKQMTGGPLVLDGLEEFTPLEIKSNVAQLLSQTDWTSKQFAKVYGIPDSYIGGQGDQQSSIDMISGMYANAISRFLRPAISELETKLGTKIESDIYPAVDPLGSIHIKRIAELVKTGTLAQNQGLFVLQEADIIPKNLPDPVDSNPVSSGKGVI